jgi:hypothetical protein
MRHSALKAIVYSGFIGGTIDLFSAALISGRSPFIILQAVASGLLGRPSFQDGGFSAILGLLLQWGMSMLIAAIYVYGVPAARRLSANWIAGGLVYGAVVFVVMNYVVVPLSAAPFKPPHTPDSIIENLLAMLLFGLIVARFRQRFAADTAAAATPA